MDENFGIHGTHYGKIQCNMIIVNKKTYIYIYIYIYDTKKGLVSFQCICNGEGNPQYIVHNRRGYRIL